eukprot:TRINITY_DN5282_c0_g2_i1.p1 TRINITY_DN5282_c0_g2~~TRINITY_DN5282_c0_g2_i1.p1  ORF type:complete len:269 (+),score=65.77 TRINITY_DN5282_c0_g2_i1:65-871(+)
MCIRDSNYGVPSRNNATAGRGSVKEEGKEAQIRREVSQWFGSRDERGFTSLSERLQRATERIPAHQVIDTYVMRKYIAYVKKYIHPSLTPEAAEVLRNFFLSLRESSDLASSMPITTRQLESLIRLSQARAKLECRTEVTKEDAEEVVELMQESLFDALEDIGGGGGNQKVKVAKAMKSVDKNNIGMLSVPKQTKIFIEKLHEEADSTGNTSLQFEFNDLMRIAKSMNMQVGDFSEFMERMNNQNVFLHRGGRLYELMSKKLSPCTLR